MYLMKRTHIKAKRQVNVPNYNTRGRFFTTKWEDVDPSIVLIMIKHSVNIQ